MEIEELAGGARALLQHPQPILAIALVAAGVVAGLAFSRALLARRVGRSRRLGARGERRARRMLARAGYRVLERQAAAFTRVRVDGREETYRVRADLMVSRRRRRYVVEVKAGPGSATVANRFTRRQMLEYARAFEDADGVLLVDAHKGRIQRIEFP